MASVYFDQTLRDLYSRDDENVDNIVLISALSVAEVQLAKSVPLPTKYCYQTPLLGTKDEDFLARKFLQLVPQLFGFVAGKMNMVIFDIDSDLSSARTHQNDARVVFGSIEPSQEPKLHFASGRNDLKIWETSRVVQINPMDHLDWLPQLSPPENHYRLLSKRNLALCGLPTPRTMVIEPAVKTVDLANPATVEEEVERMMLLCRIHKLPFVLKLPQSTGGVGSWLVRNETERNEALMALEPETRRMLKAITKRNDYLQPCSILLQEFLPAEAIAVSFFVTQKGNMILTGCCFQLVDSKGQWHGGYIDYDKQDELEGSYRETIATVAKYLHDNGYCGPAGVDIITDADGAQLVIDMNVRVTGSYSLGLMKGFYTERGYKMAMTLFPYLFRGMREEFDDVFERELRDGSVVVSGWCHTRKDDVSMATLNIAAADMKGLKDLRAKLQQYEVV